MSPEQEIKELKEMVEYLGRNYVTELPSRHLFMGSVARMMTVGTPFVLAMYDVDGLHTVNRLEGHLKGDELLREVAQNLKAMGDSYNEVYHIGGDEFFVIAFNTEDILDIPNTTSASISSTQYSDVNDMIDIVDKMVSAKKKATKRRRREDL